MVKEKEPPTPELAATMREAEHALETLPEGSVNDLASWWTRWYAVTGHRRLGRLLVSRGRSSLGKREEPGTPSAGVENPKYSVKGRIVEHGVKYTIAETALDSPAFFDVKEAAGEVSIILNSQHPAFVFLHAMLERQQDLNGNGKDAVGQSARVVFLFLKAWSEVERHQPHGQRRAHIRTAREDWGRALRDALNGAKEQL